MRQDRDERADCEHERGSGATVSDPKRASDRDQIEHDTGSLQRPRCRTEELIERPEAPEAQRARVTARVDAECPDAARQPDERWMAARDVADPQLRLCHVEQREPAGVGQDAQRDQQWRREQDQQCHTECEPTTAPSRSFISNRALGIVDFSSPDRAGVVGDVPCGDAYRGGGIHAASVHGRLRDVRSGETLHDAQRAESSRRLMVGSRALGEVGAVCEEPLVGLDHHRRVRVASAPIPAPYAPSWCRTTTTRCRATSGTARRAPVRSPASALHRDARRVRPGAIAPVSRFPHGRRVLAASLASCRTPPRRCCRPQDRAVAPREGKRRRGRPRARTGSGCRPGPARIRARRRQRTRRGWP